jgi:ABC-type nitrate/sulfonate/bicarbonate transport system permease component
VVGEMFGGSEGIGFMVNYGGQTFQTDTCSWASRSSRCRNHV